MLEKHLFALPMFFLFLFFERKEIPKLVWWISKKSHWKSYIASLFVLADIDKITQTFSISFTTLSPLLISNIICTFWVLADTTTCVFRRSILFEGNITQKENTRGIMHMRSVVVVLFLFILSANYYSQSIRILFGRILWISLFDETKNISMNLNAITSDVVGETVCLYIFCWVVINKRDT